MKQKIRSFCSTCGGKTIKRREGDTLRDYCPKCGLFFYSNPLPVVSCIVTLERKILLVKRRNKPYRGLWCLPTGFAETGESIEEAALRELEEEAGIRGRVVHLIDVDSCRNYFYGDLLFLTFEVETVSGTPLAGSDATDIDFFPIDALPKLAFSSNARAIETFSQIKAEQWAIADSFALTVAPPQDKPAPYNLLSNRLISIIETNASDIIQRWLDDIVTRQSTVGYQQLNRSWLFKGARSILSQFGKWLGRYYTDSEIKAFYVRLGRGSRREGLLLSEVLSSWSILRKHILTYAAARDVWLKTIDIYAALELSQRIVIFFDKAVFYTAKGYESDSAARPRSGGQVRGRINR